ncbi:MAG: ribonuclease III [Candidatus Dadabacteria bacterium]|nr:MAG: ribonuclease III [Candidatus Dadabacteria bacterium]
MRGKEPQTARPRVDLEKRLGYQFAKPELLEQALVHPSLAPERGFDNERLEFLGDAVLGLAIGERLMREFPELDEGGLSRMRAALVGAPSLAALAADLGLHDYLLLGRGEEKSGGRGKTRILAACYEAVIGAIFLDGGYGAARNAIDRHFGKDLQRRAERYCDFKSALQELSQARYGQPPEYRTIAVSGPDHARRYRIEVVVGGHVLGVAEGGSRKRAEQRAAEQALDALGESADAGR